MKKVLLIVMDSVGIGEAPDAKDYDDVGSATLQHTAEAVGGLKVPTLEKLGLGNIPNMIPNEAIKGVSAVEHPQASFGAMQEVSQGKDTITGHWEIAGLELNPGFHLFPPDFPSFPDEIMKPFTERTGRECIGNKAASGTAVIEELGEQSMKEGKFILYTSGDSVMQLAAHTDVISIEEMYRACEVGRELCDPYRVGRVIARPFIGKPGKFERTEQRKDYAYKSDEPTILEKLEQAKVPTYAVGKIEDIVAHRGIFKSNHTGNNLTSQAATLEYFHEMEGGLLFANFIDYDMLYGHRRDPEGYARAVEQTDGFFADLIPQLGDEDILIITADHGNDPTFKGSDHTREYVPLLVVEPGKPSRNLGIRNGFYDIAQSIADAFGIDSMPRGKSFL